jgi:hypothetical protein
VDPIERTLEVLRLRDGAWTIGAVHGGDDRVRAEPSDAVELELGALWIDPESAPECGTRQLSRNLPSLLHVQLLCSRITEQEKAMGEQVASTAHPDEKWLYRVGGIAALLIGIAYVLTIPLFVSVAAPAAAGEARLVYLAANAKVWWAILDLMVGTDLLWIPVAFALCVAYKGINKHAMLLAAAFMLLFVVLDLAVTWTNYAALLTLSHSYAAATTAAEKAALSAAAHYADSVLGSGLEAVFAMAILATGILIAGLVMLKGIFNKTTAILGVVTGVLGILSIVVPYFVGPFSVAIMAASVCTTLWAYFVGFGLWKLGRQ